MSPQEDGANLIRLSYEKIQCLHSSISNSSAVLDIDAADRVEIMYN